MLDFEYAKALAEVVLDTTCSEKESTAGVFNPNIWQSKCLFKERLLTRCGRGFFCAKNERFATGIDKAGYAGFFESQYTPLFWRGIYS